MPEATTTKANESCLRRALEVQRIYLLHKEDGIPNTYIYRKYIYPVFFISERTFYRYLRRNVKRELRQLQQDHENTTD